MFHVGNPEETPSVKLIYKEGEWVKMLRIPVRRTSHDTETRSSGISGSLLLTYHAIQSQK